VSGEKKECIVLLAVLDFILKKMIARELNIMAGSFDKKCMELALKLAEKGNGNVSPNPMVGAVIAKKEKHRNKIAGIGWHEYFGGNHAEVNAIKNAGKNAKGGTLYVTLEPCRHYGKTPPCTKTIIAAGIKKVFAAMKDPNPLVSGKGILELKKAGIKVEAGLMEKESRKLNEKYVYWMENKKPFIALKFAVTSNGMISWGNGIRKKISSKESIKKMHELRGEFDAILAGIGTVKKDNPMLTTHGKKGNNPYRIILDTNFEIPLNAKAIGKDRKCIIATTKKAIGEKKSKARALEKKAILFELKEKGKNVDLKELLYCLGKINVSSVMVEGGQKILSSFIAEKLAQKAIVFVSPKIVENGLFFVDRKKVKKFELKNCIAEKSGKDVLVEGYF